LAAACTDVGVPEIPHVALNDNPAGSEGDEVQLRIVPPEFITLTAEMATFLEKVNGDPE
jgi:hypothetical protein